MVSFELQHINSVTRWWYQFLLDISKIKLGENTDIPMGLSMLIMLLLGGIVFVILRAMYGHYDIDCYPLLEFLLIVIGSIAIIICASVVTSLMDPPMVYETEIATVNKQYNNILKTEGMNKVKVHQGTLELVFNTGDKVKIADLSNSTGNKLVIKPVNTIGDAYVKTLSQLKKHKDLYNLEIYVTPMETIAKWQNTKGNQKLIVKSE